MLGKELIEQYRSLKKSCLVLGASGESGKAILKEIAKLKLFARVILVVRRKLDYEDEEMLKFVHISRYIN